MPPNDPTKLPVGYHMPKIPRAWIDRRSHVMKGQNYALINGVVYSIVG